MKKTIRLLIALIGFSIASTSFINAQGVSINSYSIPPDSSAGLDVWFANKGVLIPRVGLLSNTDVVTIPSPAISLLVYNTDTAMINGGLGFYYWDGAEWRPIAQTPPTCITAPGTPGAINGNPVVCTGAVGSYFIAPVPGATGYNWTYSGTGTTASGSGSLITLAFSDSATPGVLSVTATNACGTSASSPTYRVAVNITPNSNFTYSPDTVTLYTSVTFTSADQEGQFYFWSFPFGHFSSTSPNPTFTWPKLDTGVVSLTVSKNGCTSTTYQTLGTAMPAHGTQTYTFQDSIQTFVVPQTGVSSVTLNVIGAQATYFEANFGGAPGGAGGRAVGTLAVTPGEILYLCVGSSQMHWNGGAIGAGIGADASDIRVGDTTLAGRIIVAGGGGSVGFDGEDNSIPGGAGGGDTGGAGASTIGQVSQFYSQNDTLIGGAGGSQSAGGAGGTASYIDNNNYNGNAGSLGQGGGASPYMMSRAGAGGGGYYGGGGGASSPNTDQDYASGGGGGSNYLDPSLTNTSNIQGYWTNGNGQITVTW